MKKCVEDVDVNAKWPKYFGGRGRPVVSKLRACYVKGTKDNKIRHA